MARSPWPESARTTPWPHWRWTTTSPGARSRSSAPRCWSARRAAGVEDRSKPPPAGRLAAGRLAAVRVPSEPRPAPNAGLASLQSVAARRKRPAVLACPGDADVGEAALLLEVARLADRADVREDVLLEARDEHHWVLESFGGVQGHQGDALGGGLDLVGVGHQRDRLEEAGQATLRVAQLVLLGHRLELADVLDPPLTLDRVVGLQFPHQAREVPGVLHQHARAASLVHPLAQLVEHGDEVRDTSRLAMAQPGDLPGAAQRLAERDALLVREALDGALGGLADAAAGHVEHPAQAHRVHRVDHRLDVGEQVFDLAPVVELDPAHHLVGQARLDERSE